MRTLTLLCAGAVAAATVAATAAPQHVVLRFALVAGAAPVVCGAPVRGIGTSSATIEAQDVRAYVSEIALVDANGRETPVTLDDDHAWQGDGVALLSWCAGGRPELHDAVAGTVPSGTYRGVRFTVGVPDALNHADATLASAPLNQTAMFWSWRAGYKFVRVEMRTVAANGTASTWLVHVGSTGCTTDRAGAIACAQPNHPVVVLHDFDWRTGAVAFDLRSLLASTDVTRSAEGCMMGAGDDCAGVLGALGLRGGVAAPADQRVSGALMLLRALLASALACVFAASARAAADDSYRWNIPWGLPRPVAAADDPMSDAKVRLGRFLFYDKRLSANGTISCASCHQQAHAFSDPRPQPVGVTGERHPRHAMRLVNLAYMPVYTWANPAMRTLEAQALVPMFGEHPVEMGLAGREKALVATLRADARYPALFAAAYPGASDAISLAGVTRALASFERALISFDAPYDRYRYGHDENAISAAAKRGEALFFGERVDCAHCHNGFNFTDNVASERLAAPEIAFHNTALYNIGGTGAYPPDNRGLADATGRAEDTGRFRTPSLRNVAAGAPYMHDGSVATLADAIDHYGAGGRTIATGPYAGTGSASPLRDAQMTRFALDAQEKRDLIAFLESLTDTGFLRDPRFADPF